MDFLGSPTHLAAKQIGDDGISIWLIPIFWFQISKVYDLMGDVSMSIARILIIRYPVNDPPVTFGVSSLLHRDVHALSVHVERHRPTGVLPYLYVVARDSSPNMRADRHVTLDHATPRMSGSK